MPGSFVDSAWATKQLHTEPVLSYSRARSIPVKKKGTRTAGSTCIRAKSNELRSADRHTPRRSLNPEYRKPRKYTSSARGPSPTATTPKPRMAQVPSRSSSSGRESGTR